MGAPVVTHLANSATLSWRTTPISYLHAHCWKQSAESYSAVPHLSSRTWLWIYPTLRVTQLCLQHDWIEDIEVQAFCINFLTYCTEVTTPHFSDTLLKRRQQGRRRRRSVRHCTCVFLVWQYVCIWPKFPPVLVFEHVNRTVVWTLSISGAQVLDHNVSVYQIIVLWSLYVCSSLWTWHLSVYCSPINTMCVMCVHFWIWIWLSLKSKKKSTSVHRPPC